ncbi:MAG: hypothetical protein ACK4RS_05420, partial [Thiothrix sp.]
MDNEQYQAVGMSQYMLREFQAQRRAHAEAATRSQTVFSYQHFSHDLLSYPIFTNPACGSIETIELQHNADDAHYCQRWHFFYEPNIAQLPQNDYQQRLEEHTWVLEQRLRILNSPRLAAFAAMFVLMLWLIARGHFMLVVVPIVVLAGYWLVTGNKIRQAQAELKHHYAELANFLVHRKRMAEQLSQLVRPAPLSHFQQRYQHAIEQLLAHTVAQVLAEREYTNIAQMLKKQGWRGFIGESWSYLQTHQAVGEPLPIALAAFRDDPLRQRQTLFRLSYLQVWIVTQHGLLLGKAHYDRVADQFLYEQHEFFSYAELRHVAIDEQVRAFPVM